MGTSVRAPVEITFKATGVDAVRSALRVVRTEAEGAAMGARGVASGLGETQRAAEGMSHSAVLGIGELVRGIGRIGESGEASAFAMRELSGGVMRLGSSLGTIGAFAGIAVLLGGAIVEAFTKARQELEKTQIEFNQRLGEMIKSANVAGLAGRYGQATGLYSGDPTAFITGKNPGESRAAFAARSEGILGLQRLKGQLEASQNTVYDAKTGLAVGKERNADLEETISLLAKMQEQYGRTMKAVDVATKQKVDEVTTGIKMAAERNNLARGGGPSAGLEKMLRDQEALQARAALAASLPSIPNISTPSGNLLDSLLGGFMGQGNLGEKDRPKVAKIVKDAYDIVAEESARQLEAMGQRIATQFADTFGNAIATGIRTAFESHSIGQGFAAAGRAMLGGLGSIFVQMGETALAGMAFIKTIKDAIIGFAPEIGIPAAIGLIALGSVLQSVGSGGSRSVSAGGGGGVYAPSSVTFGAVSVDPRHPAGANVVPTAGVTVNATIIGKDDPRAQRELMEMIARATRRGTTSG